MIILFLSRLLYLTGVSTHMRDLGSELVRMGHSVTILTAGSQFIDDEACRILEKSIRDAGILIETIPFPRTSKNSLFFLSADDKASMVDPVLYEAKQIRCNSW